MFTFWPQSLNYAELSTPWTPSRGHYHLACGPTLSLLHLVSNMFMINHSTSNRSAPPPLSPWDPDDCLMSRHETMGSRCVIDGERTTFISGKALRFSVTDIRSHPLARRASWLQGWLMTPYWQQERHVSSLIQIWNNMVCTAHAYFELLMIPEYLYAHLKVRLRQCKPHVFFILKVMCSWTLYCKAANIGCEWIYEDGNTARE